MKYTSAVNVLASSCDFNYSTSSQGLEPYPSSDPFERSFYVNWPSFKTITSFFIDSQGEVNWVDVYVSYEFPFTRNDPYYKVLSDQYPVGVFNLPNPRRGKYLIFMPRDDQDAGKFNIREIRVWSQKDMSQSVQNGDQWIIKTVGGGNGCIGTSISTWCISPGNYEPKTKPFSVDLGGIIKVHFIWILFGQDSGLDVCIGYQDLAPFMNTSFLVVNKECFLTTAYKEHQRVINADTRYVYVCVVNAFDGCREAVNFYIKKIAIFKTGFVDPCINSAISSQTIGPASSYIVQATLPNPKVVLEFDFFTDTHGLSTHPYACGMKKFTTNKTWATVLIPADPVAGKYQLIVDTNIYDPLFHTINVTVGYAHPEYLQVRSFDVSVTFIHPCKNALITSDQIILPIKHMFGEPQVQYSFYPFVNSVNAVYGFTLCGMIYKLEPTSSASNFGVSIQVQSIIVNCLDINKIGTSVQLSLYGEDPYPQIPASQRVVFTVEILSPCLNTTIQFQLSSTFSISYIITTTTAAYDFTLPTDTKSQYYSQQVTQMCGQFQYEFTPSQYSSWISVQVNQIRVFTQLLSNAGSHLVTMKVSLVNFPTVQSQSVQFSVNLINPCYTTTLSLPQPSPRTLVSCDGLQVNRYYYPATDSAATAAGIPSLCGKRVYWYGENFAFLVQLFTPSGETEHYSQPGWTGMKSTNLSDVGNHTVTLWVKLQDYQSVSPVSKPIAVTIHHVCVTTAIRSQSIPTIVYQIRQSGGERTLATFTMHEDSGGISQNDPLLCGVKTYSTGLPWLSVYATANSPTHQFEFRGTASHPMVYQEMTFQLIVGFANPSLTQTLTETITIQLLHPCYETFCSTSQTITNLSYLFGELPLVTSFADFNDSVSTQFQTANFCDLYYDISPAAIKAQFQVLFNQPAKWFQIRSFDRNHIGQTFILSLFAYSNVAPPASNQSTLVSFNLTVTDPCPFTAINALSSSFDTMYYVVAASAVLQNFAALGNSKAELTAIPDLCGPIEYSIVQAYPWSTVSFVNGTGAISVQTSQISHAGDHQATFQAKLVNYSAVAPLQVTFLVKITNPCLTTTLSLNTTFLPVTITSLSGNGNSQNFEPATDSASTTALIPGLCGNRIYSIVEAFAQNFVSIVEPANDQDPLTQPWKLKSLSGSLADVGNYTVTLKAVLQLYPSITATKTVAVTVRHICFNTVILSQVQLMLPSKYILEHSVTSPQSILAFPMHHDSVGDAKNQMMICGIKTYSTGLDWLTVQQPSDPENQNFQLMVATNAISLVGDHQVNLVVGFSVADLNMTLTETFNVTLRHPCIKTTVTSTQVIPTQRFYFGNTALQYNFQDFINTVAIEYGDSNLCTMVYRLLPDANAQYFGVQILSGNVINVLTTNQSLIGQSVTLDLRGFYNSVQNSANQPVTFTVQIVDSCPDTVISLPFTTLLSMNYIITQSPSLQTFAYGNDSKSALTQIPNLCGPIFYSIEGYSFVTITTGTIEGQIQIQTNFIQHTGVYTATFNAKLPNYPTVAHVNVTFQITIVNPCLTTTLVLPTVLSPITIVAMSGQSSSQVFAPATDSASTSANIPGLCGSRIYSIVEVSYRSFVKVVPGGLDPFMDNQSITFQSFSMDDRGVWTVTLQASLQQYLDVQPATSIVQVTVLDPCLTTVIQPELISDMSISIYDITPKTQTFVPFKDTESNFQNILNFCGPKQYVISNPMTWLASPGSNEVNILTWTISAVTNDIRQVGTHIFTVTATLEQYQSVEASIVTFNLIVIDNCATAILTSQGQELNAMVYYPLISVAPTAQTFQPFSDSVALQYSNPQICGKKTYVIAESFSFVQITPPPTDPFTNPWNLTVETNLLSQIAVYTVTVVATLDKYPSVAPATLQFTIYISHPCDLTVLKPQQLTSMSFTLGFVQTVTQVFPQFKDKVGDETQNQKECGERIYRLIDGYSFLNLQIPVDPWNSNLQIELFAADSTKVGEYSASLQVNLVGYSLPPPLVVNFRVTILPKPKNNLPYFQPKLSGYSVIKKTNAPSSWILKLPAIVDLDNDPVTISAEFGSAESFLELNGMTSILCKDISLNTKINAGMYLIRIMLNDQKDIVTYNFAIFVDDLQLQVTQTFAKNETSTNEPNDDQSSEQQAQLIESIQFDQPLITHEMSEDKKEAILTQAKFDWQAAFAKQKALENQSKRDQFFIIPPKPFFKDFKPDGQVILGFQSDVYIVPNLQMINNGTIYLEDFQIKRALLADRNLAVTTTINNQKKRIPVLQVEVVPGLESNAADLQFVWNVTQQESQSLHVQLYFENPYRVSANPVSRLYQQHQQIPDKVKITFNDPSLFVGMNGITMDPQSQILERYLPTQVPMNGAAAAVAEAIVTATSGAQVVVVGNFVLNLLMSASLNQLWSMINTQQLIVLMPLFKVQMPASAQSFFNQILKIASFDIIDLTPRLDKMLRLNATEPLNPNFEALGFGSLYFLNNMNSMLVGFLVYFGMILILVMIDPLQTRCRKLKLSTVTEKLRGMLFYNFIVSMMTESYSLMSVCTMIGLFKISFSSVGEIIQTVSCLSALAVLIIYPLFILIHIGRNWKNTQKMADLVQNCKAIFEDLRTDSGRISLLHPMFFLIRRFLMAVIVVVLRNHLIFQVMLKAFSIIAAVIISGEIPYNRSSKRKTEFLNETIIMFVLYTMICFSPFVPDPDAKQLMGYFCCFMVACHLLVNLYLILGTQAQELIWHTKLWLARRKLQHQRDRNSVKIKSRKHSRKEFQQIGIIISDESEEIDLPDQVGKPSKRYQLEKIEEEKEEEEEIVSESEIKGPVLTIKEEKASIQKDLLLLEKLVNDHFADAEKQERDIFLRQTKLQPSVKQITSVKPSFAQMEKQISEKMNVGKSFQKREQIYDLDSLLDLDDDDRKNIRKQQKSKDSKSDENSSGTVEDMWYAQNDFRSKNTELALARKDPKARGHKDNRTKFF